MQQKLHVYFQHALLSKKVFSPVINLYITYCNQRNPQVTFPITQVCIFNHINWKYFKDIHINSHYRILWNVSLNITIIEILFYFTAGVTGRKGMLTPARQLIPPLVFVQISISYSLWYFIFDHYLLAFKHDFAKMMHLRLECESINKKWKCHIDFVS